ncbi:hypothetical protein DPX16_17339, partial [Anabarilius grahami]
AQQTSLEDFLNSSIRRMESQERNLNETGRAVQALVAQIVVWSLFVVVSSVPDRSPSCSSSCLVARLDPGVISPPLFTSPPHDTNRSSQSLRLPNYTLLERLHKNEDAFINYTDYKHFQFKAQADGRPFGSFCLSADYVFSECSTLSAEVGHRLLFFWPIRHVESMLELVGQSGHLIILIGCSATATCWYGKAFLLTQAQNGRATWLLGVERWFGVSGQLWTQTLPT